MRPIPGVFVGRRTGEGGSFVVVRGRSRGVVVVVSGRAPSVRLAKMLAGRPRLEHPNFAWRESSRQPRRRQRRDLPRTPDRTGLDGTGLDWTGRDGTYAHLVEPMYEYVPAATCAEGKDRAVAKNYPKPYSVVLHAGSAKQTTRPCPPRPMLSRNTTLALQIPYALRVSPPRARLEVCCATRGRSLCQRSGAHRALAR